MFYFNVRFKFKAPVVEPSISGSIIAASAISPVDLQKRGFAKYSHLKKRFLDPQLYMSSIDPALDSDTVAKLSAYPWFHGRGIPKYDSGEYANRKEWKKKHEPKLVSKWTRTVTTDLEGVRNAARAAVEFQQRIGCEGIILAAPLTTMVDQSLQSEVAWLDAGLEACADLNVKGPLYATIALSEDILQVPALKNQIIHSLSNQVSARSELAGAYIILEQFNPGNYFWTSKDALMSLMVLVDDLHRGASKKVIVNYLGTFGLVAAAAGAQIWSSGYYLSQRRFSRQGVMGIARPRYHSLALAGDIGLKDDLARIHDAGLAKVLMTPSHADAVLRVALTRGKTPADVPEWRYSPNNCSAAQAHYLEVVSEAASKLEVMNPPDRREWVQKWLDGAVASARTLKEKNLNGPGTETDHQKVWQDVYKEWRDYAKQ